MSGVDPTIVAALMGGGVALVVASTPFFVAWGSVHATIEALKTRISAVEAELATINALKSDVSFIRGLLEGERRT